jgi:hypothetical protein
LCSLDDHRSSQEKQQSQSPTPARTSRRWFIAAALLRARRRQQPDVLCVGRFISRVSISRLRKEPRDAGRAGVGRQRRRKPPAGPAPTAPTMRRARGRQRAGGLRWLPAQALAICAVLAGAAALESGQHPPAFRMTSLDEKEVREGQEWLARIQRYADEEAKCEAKKLQPASGNMVASSPARQLLLTAVFGLAVPGD